MICALAWNNRRRLLAVRLFFRSFAQAGMFSCVPLPPATAVRPPHRTQNEACCVWKTAAVKQPSVRSLPFITERFISAVKKPLRFEPLVRASPYLCGTRNRPVFAAAGFQSVDLSTSTGTPP